MAGLERPLVMGVLNVTPDSFSDGGLYLDADAAVAHAGEMAAEGASIIDVGGESTRPGAERVPESDELARVIPVVERIAVDLEPPGTLDHNLELIRRLDEIVAIGTPVVIGTSRKSFIGRLTGRPERERAAGTVAANVIAYERGASIFRVHDVVEAVDSLKVAAATVGQWTTSPSA